MAALMFNEAIVAACLFVVCVCLRLLLACEAHEFSCTSHLFTCTSTSMFIDECQVQVPLYIYMSNTSAYIHTLKNAICKFKKLQ